MKAKKLLILFFIGALFSPLFSQSWNEVKNDPRYYVGEGYGVTLKEADDHALAAIISQISVKITSEGKKTDNTIIEQGGEKVSSSVSYEAKIKTYSNATLNNTQREIIQNEPDAHVARWILKSEVDKIFKARENKIREFVDASIRSEKKGQIDNCLKYISWGNALLSTLQSPDTVRYVDAQGKSHNLSVWLNERVDQILRSVKISVLNRSEDNAQLSFTYDGHPVSSLEFSYFDGRDWSSSVCVKDGIGVLELAPGFVASVYQLKIEYEYRQQSHVDKDVKDAYELLTAQSIKSAYKNVPLAEPSDRADAPEVASVSASENATASSYTTIPQEVFRKPELLTDDAAYRSVLNELVQQISQRRYSGLQQHFTTEGYDIYTRLIGYGKATIVGQPKCAFYSFGERVIARGLMMSFSFENGLHKRFVEEVVFTFDSDRKIENIAFGLGQTAEDDILGKGMWPENARMAIMQFLENYKTAYALKRLDYIEGVFDEDAVIITGTVVKRAPKGDDSGNIYLKDEIVKYSRYNKRSYMQHLRKSFQSKEYINLRFADNDVKRMGRGGELYAIQISQEYYSSNYGDKGYLFLMVDINDPESPIIKVRTWQPDKDPEFGLYGPEHFR